MRTKTEFTKSNWDRWLRSEILEQLKTVPSEIRERAFRDKNTYEIVLASVCRKLAFNSNSKNVKDQFRQALVNALYFPESPSGSIKVQFS